MVCEAGCGRKVESEGAPRALLEGEGVKRLPSLYYVI